MNKTINFKNVAFITFFLFIIFIFVNFNLFFKEKNKSNNGNNQNEFNEYNYEDSNKNDVQLYGTFSISNNNLLEEVRHRKQQRLNILNNGNWQ